MFAQSWPGNETREWDLWEPWRSASGKTLQQTREEKVQRMKERMWTVCSSHQRSLGMKLIGKEKGEMGLFSDHCWKLTWWRSNRIEADRKKRKKKKLLPQALLKWWEHRNNYKPVTLGLYSRDLFIGESSRDPKLCLQSISNNRAVRDLTSLIKWQPLSTGPLLALLFQKGTVTATRWEDVQEAQNGSLSLPT